MPKKFRIKSKEQDLIDEIKSEMQKALDYAWESNDTKAKEYQKILFPNGKPTLDNFIMTIAKKAKKQ